MRFFIIMDSGEFYYRTLFSAPWPRGPARRPQIQRRQPAPFDRPGPGKNASAALGMKSLGLNFDAVLSSPYLRAWQTAEIVAQVYKFKNKKIHLTDNLLPPASIEELLKEVRARFPRSGNVLLVGHEPHLSEMVSRLLKSDKPLVIDFKKGGLCCLSLRYPPGSDRAVLNWLLTPAQLDLFNPAF